jgi:parvulin-like peptidyl-prolyl cis-trans isomerase-like protein
MTTRHPEPAAGGRCPAKILSMVLLFVIMTSLLVLSGCGGDNGAKTLATVGDYEIKSDYYEFMLSKLKAEDMPYGENGLPIDTATPEGKLAFLNILINKELMAQKAKQLGFGKNEDVNNASKVVSEYEAGKLMHEELIDNPCADISDEDVQAYYDKMGITRNFQFIICNFEDDALKARERVAAGELWDDVADEFNDGSRGPQGDYTVSIRYGQVEDTFEQAIYSLAEGEITQPVNSVYGWWVLRFNSETNDRVQPLDEQLTERIRATLVGRCVNIKRTEFLEASREKHEFKFDETALWIIFQGMPEVEPYLDAETNQPVPQGQLQKLDVPLSDLDKFFYSCRFDLEREAEVWTIGDYKELYDGMNVFQRPKRSDMLGGVRKKFMEDMIDRQLLKSEARERGYEDRPEVTSESKQRSEQVMITKLHEEVVQFDEVITPEQLEAFWVDHKSDYAIPAHRVGRIVNCRDEDSAKLAHAAALGGASWDEIMATYEQTSENKAVDGVVAFMPNDVGSDRDAMYMLENIGDLSDPVPANGFWVVVKYEEDRPEGFRDLEDVRESIGQRMKALRKDKALRDLLDKWRIEFEAEINESNLGAVKSWE